MVGFTHAFSQIPGISSSRYPPSLAGPLYAAGGDGGGGGLPIWPEDDLETVIREHRVQRAVMSYSDLSYDQVSAAALWASSRRSVCGVRAIADCDGNEHSYSTAGAIQQPVAYIHHFTCCATRCALTHPKILVLTLFVGPESLALLDASTR